MPELSRFYNIIIKMYFSDNTQHHKPHFHVYYGEHEAIIAIDGELLAGSLPKKQYRLVQAWNLAVQNKHFDKIAPLS